MSGWLHGFVEGSLEVESCVVVGTLEGFFFSEVYAILLNYV